MKSYNSLRSSNFILVDSSQLESLSFKPQKRNFSWVNGLKQLAKSFVRSIANSSEPRISKKVDRNGNLYYKVYDPTSGASAVFSTEQEIRIWIDQRYYQ